MNKTLRCAIVDDEPLALDLMESYVARTPFLQLVSRYSSAITARKGIEEEPVDLLFLDIQMPELNGLDFAKTLDKDTRVIFTTAFSQYAADSYRANALDYLLKPFSYEDFLEASQKALEWYNSRPQIIEPQPCDDGFLFVKCEYRMVKIWLKDILYIEGLKDYVKIYLEGKPKPVLTLISMKVLEEHLPASRFFRVHRSYIVQLDKIEEVERGRIVFDKAYIPISDSNREFIQKYICSHSIQ